MSSRWELPTRKKWNTPVCTPTDMREFRRPTEVGSVLASRNAARIADRGLRRQHGVIFGVEQQQQCVAAELQEASALLVCNRQHPREDVIRAHR